MIGKLLALPILSASFMVSAPKTQKQVSSNDTYFTYELLEDGTYKVTGVSDSHLQDKELRIYATTDNFEITEIGANAFDGATNLESLMITRNVVKIAEGALSNSYIINYTGSSEEWDEIGYVGVSGLVNYGLDEGFINLWNDTIKITSVCDIDETTYRLLNSKYLILGVDDRVEVDKYEFDQVHHYTIKDGMKTLSQKYDKKAAPEKGPTFDQNTTLIMVVVISLIGMTAMCVFYSFKDNNIIE